MSESGAHHEYERAALTESDLHPDPFVQCLQWLDDAASDERVDEPNAMTLATVGADGSPSARVVLMRGLDQRGLTFYTNYESRKGIELSIDDRVAVVFYWAALQRQLRVEGTAAKIDTTESDTYFASRPVRSQMGALASNQSAVIQNREVLEAAMRKIEAQHEPVARPTHWGGYRIKPGTFEFWQGRPSRLHDRLRYRLIDESWVVDRLAP